MANHLPREVNHKTSTQGIPSDSIRTPDALKEKELAARIAKHLEPEVGFMERLVLFFSNHFSMCIHKDGAVLATIGQLERDVIRRHVLGSFKSLLLGVMKHTAMIAFLDNSISIGPNSIDGRNLGLGLNLNLAREILELHTLGVNGGYSEADIAALAKVITGWSFVRGPESELGYNGGTAENWGQFVFRPTWHEPGQQVLLGKTYAQSGIDMGEAALSDLAIHPSTAQFLAFKLVRHFITDNPTPDMVNPVARAFLVSDGSLLATAKALVNLPAAWSAPLSKIRTPYELQVAEMRALTTVYNQDYFWTFSSALFALHNAQWSRQTPDGYPEETSYWSAPDALRVRLETAQLNSWALLNLSRLRIGVHRLADSLFDSALSKESRKAILGASSQATGLATLFMIPEFQRR